MLVNEIFLDGFRNYENVTARFNDGVNVIYGRNAQGKTNLIEAVFYLATGRPLRSGGDKDMINFSRDNALIRARIVSNEREQKLEARLFRGRSRTLFANDVKLKKASELSGKLTAVQFGPDDLNLVKEGAMIRRKLMDNCLSQLRPGYLAALTEFNRLYEHKTRILRDNFKKPSLLELLDDYNQRLCELSAKMIYYRSAFSIGLARRAAEVHKEFSGGAEEMTISYKTVGDMSVAGLKPEEILPGLIEHQKQMRQAELSSGLCLSGSHKDDLIIEIDGTSARKFASQGQARTAAISIKLAERDIHFDVRGEYPVLLLDDVLSELDSLRRSYILGRILNGQVLITCCDEGVMPASDVAGSAVLRVEDGMIIQS
jgi:DNA replication and repair protein RecF